MQQNDAVIGADKADSRTDVLHEVRAKRFVLEDDDGNVRAEIKMSPDGPSFYMYDDDERQKPAIAIGARGNSWFVSIDMDGRDEVALISGRRDGAEIWICDAAGHGRVWKPGMPVGVTVEGRRENRVRRNYGS